MVNRPPTWEDRPLRHPYPQPCKILDMTDETPAPPEPKQKTKQWIGGEIPIKLYDDLKKIAEDDMVPLTVVYRWALSDYVARREAQ